MGTTDRLRSERLFHNQQAHERTATFDLRPHELRFDDGAYLDHESWIRPAFERLGSVRDMRVLDYGCGHAMASVVLARRGARVVAFDLSSGYLSEAKRRAYANEVSLQFVQADAERLPFSDASFDRVWGNAVLHHLDLALAARELHRVLRPGGVAVFCEPWGGNPVLSWARRRLSYPAKGRTPDEEPLRFRQLRTLWQVFGRVEVQGFQFLSMVRRVVRSQRLIRCLDRCDARLLTWAPVLQGYCRYVVLTLRH
jgi:SAM-dependent methyltransferase